MRITSSRRAASVAVAIASAVASTVLSISSPASAGTNLLPSDAATFASGTGGWVASNATLSRVSSPNQTGPGALRAVARSSGQIGLMSGSSTATYVPVAEGATYAADAWVRAAKSTRTAQPVITFYDGAGTAIAWAWGSGIVEDRRSFRSLPTVTSVAPANARYASLGVVIYGVARNETHYVDTARIEQTAAAPQPDPDPAPEPTDVRPLLGVTDRIFNQTGDGTRFAAMEAWQQRANAVGMIYMGFSADWLDFDFDRIDGMWEHGSVPMVTWMPNVDTTKGPDHNATVAAGDHDAYIRAWVGRMKSFLAGPDSVYGNADDRRAYLRFAHEPNGDWYPYAPTYANTPPSSYVAMWRHVHDMFVAEGIDDVTRLAWVFSVNNFDSPTTVKMEQLYPGDAYVDWVGIDGYNRGTTLGRWWETSSEVFDHMVTRLRVLTDKPIGINETGSVTDGSIAAKSEWIAQYFSWVKANDIRLSMWFNDHPAKWEIFGGDVGDEVISGFNAYSTYRTAVQDPMFVSSDRANARLLTDSQFTGR